EVPQGPGEQGSELVVAGILGQQALSNGYGLAELLLSLRQSIGVPEEFAPTVMNPSRARAILGNLGELGPEPLPVTQRLAVLRLGLKDHLQEPVAVPRLGVGQGQLAPIIRYGGEIGRQTLSDLDLLEAFRNP